MKRAARLADVLPDFPWDVLAPFAEQARQHPGGIVDLSVGTPVDPTPEVIQAALRASSDAPGYPTTTGLPAVREACARWLGRSLGVAISPDAIQPATGTKELVASLPRQLGLLPGARVVIPRIAYPTYAVGSILAGCEYHATDVPEEVDGVDLVWLNSPANPTGRVLTAERMREIVEWARARGAIVVSDECYIELGWEVEPVSLLHPSVCGDSHEGLLVLHSLSKRSNLAGYRFGFAAGDRALIGDLLAVRKHIGMMVPTPIQRAAIAAFDDDEHVAAQRQAYRLRRDILRASILTAGFHIDHSEAGLYLWATRGEDCWQTVRWFAERGILVTPGDFYGPAGAQHVRIALTGTDANFEALAVRLASE